MDSICHCGVVGVERTAWTEANAGRRFISCFRGALGCGFFRWVDPPMSNRSLTVINGLLRRVRVLEESHIGDLQRLVSAHEREVMKLKKGPLVCRFTVGIVMLLLVVFFIFVGKEIDDSGSI